MTNNAQLLPLPEPGCRLNAVQIGDKKVDVSLSCYTAEQMQSYALACIEAAKPTCKQTLQVDALGSLPVVAWMHLQREYSEPMPRRLDQDELNRGWTEYPLTDHAKATAEIAKWRTTAELHKENYDIINGNLRLENAALRAKLAGVDGLVEALRKISVSSGNQGLFSGMSFGQVEEMANNAIATFEAAQGEKK